MNKVLRTSLFKRTDPFSIYPGEAPIVVAAPHHGTHSFSDADLATGPIAVLLAEKLQARAVIANDLRRTVDVNKNPAGLPSLVRPYALRYQNEVFKQLPRLVIEVHGHVRGHYPIEISSGFDLSSEAQGDVLFLDHLRKLAQELPGHLRNLGHEFGVGIYPLDHHVRQTATNTFTFQKIRRARNRVGLEWYGLHIELAADLRTSDRAKAPGYYESLAGSLAAAIQSAFLPLPGPASFIPTHADLHDNQVSGGRQMRVIKAPQDLAEMTIVILNSQDVESLGYLESDLLPLSRRGETLRVPIAASASIPPGRLALPARLRNQLDLVPGQHVTVFPAVQPAMGIIQNDEIALVVAGIKQDHSMQIGLNPADRDRLEAGVEMRHHARSMPRYDSSVPIQLAADANTPQRMVKVSEALADKLLLTMGDMIMLGSDQ